MKCPSSISSSEWHVPLRIAGRLLLLLFLSALGYLAIARYTGLAHPHRYLVRVQQAAARNPDLLILGDSVLFSRDLRGADTRSLEQRLIDAFPERAVVSISKAGANPEVYLDTWRYLRTYGAAPRAVVVLLNLRSFSSTLYRRPDSEFPRIQYEMKWDSMASRALYRPLAVFKFIDTQPTGRAEYEDLLRYELAGAPAWLERPAEEEARWNGMAFREHFYLRYGMPIDPEHPALAAMAEFVECLRREGDSVFLFLTPIDIERGRAELGSGIDALVDHNRQVIREALAPIMARDSGVRYYDASTLLPASEFMHDQGPPNEHLYDPGLGALSGELLPRIAEMLRETPRAVVEAPG